MTGYGEAHSHDSGLAVSIEVRTINSRHFKLSARLGDVFSCLEPFVEEVVRSRIRRGTVQVNLRVERAHRPEDYKLNLDVLASYRQQCEEFARRSGLTVAPSLDALLQLPGAVDEHTPGAEEAERDWPAVRKVLEAALDRLGEMRAQEGRAMAADLQANCQTIADELEAVIARAPLVTQGYRERLTERIGRILSEQGVTLQPGDLIREVGIFAERCDISEETVRLRSHVDQFRATLAVDESAGRKLEFVVQEMGRETNTIGSKSNDVEIVRRVIEIKAALERIREMIQNVE